MQAKNQGERCKGFDQGERRKSDGEKKGRTDARTNKCTNGAAAEIPDDVRHSDIKGTAQKQESIDEACMHGG